MEYEEILTPETEEPTEDSSKENSEANRKNKYILKLNSTPYHLTIELLSKSNINFELRQADKISYDYYKSIYNFENILSLFHLGKNIYSNASKIIELFDTLLKNEKVFLKKDDNKNKIYLSIKLEQSSKEEEYYIYFEKRVMNEKQMNSILVDEINEIKNGKNFKDNVKDNSGNENNYEEELKNIDEEMNKLILKKEEVQQKINSNSLMNKNNFGNAIIIKVRINNKLSEGYFKFLHIEYINPSEIDVFVNGIRFKIDDSYWLRFSPKKAGLYTILILFNTKITNCKSLFYDCNKITEIDLSFFNSENVTSMEGMFSYCKSLLKINLSSFCTKNVTKMNSMFYNCENLKELNLSSFDTHNVEDMAEMFKNCENLKELDLSSFDTHNVKKMNEIFNSCCSLVNLNLSSFNYDKIQDLESIFDHCYNLGKIKINKNSEKIRKLVNENFIKLEDN